MLVRSYRSNLLNRLRFFRKSDAGSSTIEAVLWLPTFVVFFVLLADVSFVFHRQSQILTVLQDGNRALSVGRIASVDDLETFVVDRLAYVTSSADVTMNINSGVLTTTVQVPVTDLVAVGMFNFLSGYDITVGSQQFIEF